MGQQNRTVEMQAQHHEFIHPLGITSKQLSLPCSLTLASNLCVAVGYIILT